MNIGEYLKKKIEWNQLTPTQQAIPTNVEAFKSFLDGRKEFDEIAEEINCLRDALLDFHGERLGETLFREFVEVITTRGAFKKYASSSAKNRENPGLIEMTAIFAFLEYLRMAIADPRIKRSDYLSSVLKEIIDGVQKLNSEGIKTETKILTAIAHPGRSKVNVKNAKATRKNDEFEKVKTLCLEWFKAPNKFTTKSALAAHFAKKTKGVSRQTIENKWIPQIIRDENPPDEWKKAFPKYLKAKK